MNWRGRPLTSHEVVVNTIAATTTTTGLKVTAALDDGTYPRGVKITGAQIRELEDTGALTRHGFHGNWNYTLHPDPAPATPAPAPPATPARGQLLDALACPELTGMTGPDLAALTATLQTPYAAILAQRHPGSPARLGLDTQVLATCLHARLRLPLHVLAYLAGVHPDTISPAIKRTRELLSQQGITITAGPARLRTLQDLYDYAATVGITLTPPTPTNTPQVPHPATTRPEPQS